MVELRDERADKTVHRLRVALDKEAVGELVQQGGAALTCLEK